MHHLVGRESEHLFLDFGKPGEVAEAAPQDESKVDEKQDHEYVVSSSHEGRSI